MVGGLSDRNNGYTPQMRKNCLVAVPVVAGSTGVGLPYALEDWPCPGDRWHWKVGSRKCDSGHWIDRCILLPPTCPPSGKKKVFRSKKSLEEYIRKEFPRVDVSAFFSSFIWQVPSADFTPQKGSQNNKRIYSSSRNSDINKQAGSGKEIKPGDCKVGNMTCNLVAKEKSNVFAAKDCDICCSEIDFCRNCCCILCSKTVDWANGRCGFIICEAKLDNHHIWGHVSHLDCALRSYMAGSVGGSNGLDVEYYCRRCDNKTDLMPHVAKLLKICESVDSRVDVEKFLNLGFCILRGSKQERANKLQNNVGVAIDKLKHGVHIDEVWKVEDNSTTPAGNLYHNGHETLLGTVGEAEEYCNDESKPMTIIEEADGRTNNSLCMTSDYNSLSVKLEGDIDQVLQELKRSQEKEFRIQEQKLRIQKDFLLSLNQQLYYERSLLRNPAPSSVGGDSDTLLSNVVHRVDQIKYEAEKVRKMMDVGREFGRIPKSVLADHYELDMTS